MAGTKSFLRRHQSGRYIVRVHDDYAVLSADGEWVLSKHETLEKAVEWCDARWPDPANQTTTETSTISAPMTANDPPNIEASRLLMAADTRAWRAVRIVGAVGEMRMATFEGRDHVVLPVIACMEAVLRPMNSEGPEFVPADVLAVAPRGWNGRPCVGPHPVDAEGTAGSANDPRLLERRAFGQLFNTYFDAETRKLHTEAWLDPTKAATVGDDAISVLTRAKTGEPIEVSIGAFVVSEYQPGEYHGRPYEYIWRLAVPDHLALLPPESTGACSYEMGCGVRAAARRSVLTADGLMFDDRETPAEDASVNRKERIAALIASGYVTEAARTQLEGLSDDEFEFVAEKSAIINALSAADSKPSAGLRGTLRSLGRAVGLQRPEAMSDDDVRSILSEALGRDVQGYRGIQAVYQTKNKVVYYMDPDPGGPTPMRLYQRKYSLDNTGAVSWSGEPEQCRAVLSFEPIRAAEEAPAPCGCKETAETTAAAAATETEEITMHRNAQRIKALIDNSETPFSEADTAFLEALTDERLAAFEPKPAPETKVEPKVEETPAEVPAVAASANPKTLAEVDMKALPKPVRDHFARLAAREQAQKDELVKALKGVQDVYTEGELTAMSLDALQKIAKLAGFGPDPGDEDMDFGALGAHRVPEQSAAANPPDPWAPGLAARAVAGR